MSETMERHRFELDPQLLEIGGLFVARACSQCALNGVADPTLVAAQVWRDLLFMLSSKLGQRHADQRLGALEQLRF